MRLALDGDVAAFGDEPGADVILGFLDERGFLRGAEAAGALLVHLGARCDAICEEKKVLSKGKRDADAEKDGAPMAMKRTLRGRTMPKMRSMYLKISTYISSSVAGAGCNKIKRQYCQC